MQLNNVVFKKVVFKKLCRQFDALGNHGFSLVELIIGAGIMMMVVAAAMHFQQKFAAASQQEEAYNQAKKGMELSLKKLKYDLEVSSARDQGYCEKSEICSKTVMERPISATDSDLLEISFGTRCRKNQGEGLSSSNLKILDQKLKEFKEMCNQVPECSNNRTAAIYRLATNVSDGSKKIKYFTHRNLPGGLCIKEDKDEKRLAVYTYATFLRLDGSLGFVSKSALLSKTNDADIELLP
tara:strand:+ start:842 stop:1558 length:717 start_codon:yes stop_codon:yes gene_type:complete